jgi:hypothetical protein
MKKEYYDSGHYAGGEGPELGRYDTQNTVSRAQFCGKAVSECLPVLRAVDFPSGVDTLVGTRLRRNIDNNNNLSHVTLCM